MKIQLSKLIPEHTNSPKRLSLVKIDAFFQWLQKNKPEVYKEGVKAIDCKDAIDDLGRATLLWR